jgi:nitrate reductase gamma subunit
MVFNAPFYNILSYIVAVSFIGGGNWRTQRKPLACRKSLTNFITLEARLLIFNHHFHQNIVKNAN